MSSKAKLFSAQPVSWKSIDPDEPGFEICQLEKHQATGTIVRVDSDKMPYEVRYKFTWNDHFEPISVEIETVKNAKTNSISLSRNNVWSDSSGPLKKFDQCVDVDLWPTPLTNSFAIKRLGLKIGDSREIDVLWIEAPPLKLHLVRQRYSRKSENAYLFEDLETGFKAEIEFDEQELVQLYPKLFQKV